MKNSLSFKLKKPTQRRVKYKIVPKELLHEWDINMDKSDDIELSDDNCIWFYSPAIPEWHYFDHKLIKMTRQEGTAIAAHRALIATKQDKPLLDKAKKILHKFDLSRLWLNLEENKTISWEVFCHEYDISLENKGKKFKKIHVDLNKEVKLEFASIENDRKNKANKAQRSKGKSTKIATAFSKTPYIPTKVNEFADYNSVSVAVLKQKKRFDPYPEKGIVQVKKDKKTSETMIWREQPNKINSLS